MRILALLGLGFVFRLLLAPYGTFELDQNTFISWGMRLNEVGFGGFYDSWSDYLPGYLYVLRILAFFSVKGVYDTEVLFKLPAMIVDIATAYLIYKIVLELYRGKKWGRERVARITTAVYLFNPAVIANSTLWGQVDAFTAFFSLLSVYLFRRHYYLSSFFLALGTVFKPQAALTAIVIVYLFFTEKKKLGEMVRYVVFSGAVFLAFFIPFFEDGNFLTFVSERVGQTLGQYPYASVNAFNLWGIWGFWKPDDIGVINPKIIGYLIFLSVSAFSFVRLLRQRKNGEYVLLAIVYLANFLFFTRLHERHLLPAIVTLSLLAPFGLHFVVVLILYSALYVANNYYSYVWVNRAFEMVFTQSQTLFLSLVAVAGFAGLLYAVFPKGRFHVKKKREFKIKDRLFIRRKKLFLGGVLAFAFLTRMLFLGMPEREYFDEVYHAFTARHVVDGDPRAWEWWNGNPEGFAFEWTHPPVAKLGMALGMGLLGQSAFAWRLPGALLGVASVYLVYRIGKKMFDSEDVGILAAAILSLDGLYLVMSRIGMNDIYFVFFGLWAFYFFLNKNYFWSSVAFGLSIASKWSALWLLPILAAVFIIEKREFRSSLAWFLPVPIIIYVISYWQMFMTGHGLDIFLGVQKQMWWYHTNLSATHSYSSSWWSWPLNLRPVYLFTSGNVNEQVRNIYAMGNPIIFWFGFLAIIVSFYFAVVERSRRLVLVVFSYLIFFVPWALAPRIMFLYHYLPSLPFLSIASAYVLLRFRRALYLYLPLGILLFFYFYPHWTGVLIPEWLDSSYYWFDNWR